jgi:hypothetical protein
MKIEDPLETKTSSNLLFEIEKILNASTPMNLKHKKLNEPYEEIVQTKYREHKEHIEVLLSELKNSSDEKLLRQLKLLLEKKDHLMLEVDNDQYDLFLLHHGAMQYAQYEVEIVDVMKKSLSYRMNLPLKKACDVYFEAFMELKETQENFVDNIILKQMKNGSKMKTMAKCLRSNTNLYSAPKYKYEHFVTRIGQILYGSQQMLHLL